MSVRLSDSHHILTIKIRISVSIEPTSSPPPARHQSISDLSTNHPDTTLLVFCSRSSITSLLP
eukprot:scaffold39905_cov144-Skeletonema_dohrnii-CCMP3373.AAC.2